MTAAAQAAASPCRVVPEQPPHTARLVITDFSWPTQGVLFRAVHEACSTPGTTVRVHVEGLRLRPAGVAAPYWLALLVSLSRLARARQCALVLVSPALELVPALLRLDLYVEQGVPAGAGVGQGDVT